MTQSYFPPPDEALDLGWPPERIMSDCRRLPREELTPKLKARLLAAGLTESQVKELYRHSRSWINSIRSHIAGGGQRHEASEKDIDLYGFDQTKREERCSMKFHEGILAGMAPTKALETCEPSRMKDITVEGLQACVDAGLSREEMAKGYGTTPASLSWKASQMKFKFPSARPAKIVTPENTKPENVSGGGTAVQPKDQPAAADQQPGAVAAAMAAFIGSEKFQEIVAANQEAAAHTPTVEELADVFGEKRPATGNRPIIVYLCGAIDYVTGEYASEWRLAATAELEAIGVTVIDPTRDGALSWTPQEVVERDLADIASADIVLVEMNNAAGGYIGTAMEIREAWEMGKIVIVWGQAFRNSKFLRYHVTKFCPSLDYALGYIEGMVAKLRKGEVG
ncbi:MAG: hypothetical protein RIN56_13330 [Sporomusaceae bacterium]|nr:hypothetical protein [Sporomusaceae bacterium]